MANISLLSFFAASYFLTHFFDSIQAELTAYEEIVRASVPQNNAFYFQGNSTETYTASLKSIDGSIQQSGSTYAKLYGQTGKAYQMLRAQMLNTPASDM